MSDILEFIDTEDYRDSIGTVDETGKRRWIFPRKPEGRFYRWRTIVSIICLSLLFVGPFLRYNGQPFLLFNFLERKFILFGIPFWPQDFHLFALAMLTLFVFVVLFTVIFGRVWCGWVCPQTVFMEMVFRKIEYWIEGTNIQQRKLDKMPWNREKILKKGSKWLIFYVIAFVIANTLMAYMIGTEELAKIVTESPVENWGRFTFVMIFSGIFFFIFAYFREQACIAVCPYGRLQGVLLGKDSIVVAYDWLRGEPRGKRRKKEVIAADDKGDCIDCKLCVAVCPTGIDIRNGTQMECVNCTACIDACDSIMDKIERPRGLIRMDSYSGIAAQTKALRFTPRIVAYSVVLITLLSVLGFSLGSRSEVETTLLRTPGMLTKKTDDGYYANLYNIQIVNKTQDEFSLELKLVDPANGRIKLAGNELSVKPQDLTKGVMFIEIPPESLHSYKQEIKVEVWSGDKLIETVETNFLGPMP
jgi:cytochrome c oxidase accessory protein FixG